MKKYVALNGGFGQFKPVKNPQAIGEWISSLRAKSTAAILKSASSPSSPMHAELEWDDNKAGHLYRLGQVRNIVLSIGIETNDGGNIRAFESVVINDSREYLDTEKISQSKDLVDQVLQSALNEISFWRLKHQKLTNFFGGVFDAITKAEEAYRRKNEKGKGRKGRKRNPQGGHKANHSANKKANRTNNHRRR